MSPFSVSASAFVMVLAIVKNLNSIWITTKAMTEAETKAEAKNLECEFALVVNCKEQDHDKSR
jgi:hypothetical protein